MASVFKRTDVRFGGAFATEKGLLVPNKNFDGTMMQNLGVQFNRQVTRLYDIGPADAVRAVYYVGGPTQGTIQVGHVIGPALALAGFLDAYSDICGADTNAISLNLSKAACGASRINRDGAQATPTPIGSEGRIGMTAKFCVLTDFGFSTEAQGLMIQSNASLMFDGMDYTEQAAA